MSGSLFPAAMGLLLIAMGLRWTLQPERVLARNPTIVRRVETVRRMGYAGIAIGAAVLLTILAQVAIA